MNMFRRCSDLELETLVRHLTREFINAESFDERDSSFKALNLAIDEEDRRAHVRSATKLQSLSTGGIWPSVRL